LQWVAIPLNWGWFNQNMPQDLELPYVYPTKKGYFLMNLRKSTGLNFPWKNSGNLPESF
jgi:hypothetical protein